MIDGWGISWEIALIWISLDFTDGKSTMVQVMDWCRQATGHYLSQCWPRSLLPYSIARPQWVNSLASRRCGCKRLVSSTSHIYGQAEDFGNSSALTLYVLNFSEWTLTCIYLLCHSSTLIRHRYLKFFLKWDKDLHILYGQYHGCWCPGDIRSQDISSYDIDRVKLR